MRACRASNEPVDSAALASSIAAMNRTSLIFALHFSAAITRVDAKAPALEKARTTCEKPGAALNTAWVVEAEKSGRLPDQRACTT